ncbi:MAG: gliding motility-associated C-terminal domain-containing protein [Saprospiraceae bacterium]|nr:gliding motility-associated C-terminal domain-containing protein [Saprospiraceae bacterium]
MKLIRLTLFLLLAGGFSLHAQDPCDPPLAAAISVSGPVCANEPVVITFSLPDDDGEGFDVTYRIGTQEFVLTGITDGHTVEFFPTASTSATLLLVVNNDDDDDDCFTNFNQTVPIQVSNLSLVISDQTDPSCGAANGSITASASGGVPALSYSLNNGPFQPGGLFQNLPAGNYTVVVQDGAGCTDAVNVTLTSSDAPTLNVTPVNPACGQANGSIAATGQGGAPPYQYSLNNGPFQASGSFNNLAAGAYTLVVRDNAGCTGSANLTLNANNAPTLSVNAQTNPDCGQTNGTLSLLATGGTPPYQYRLGNGAFQSSPTFGGLAAGVYQVFVRDNAGCVQGISATLNDPGDNLPPAVVNANEDEGCADAVFSLTGNLPSGTSGVWSAPGAPLAPPGGTVWNLSGLAPGIYTIVWTLSAPGCANYDTAQVQIEVWENPEANTDGIFTIMQGSSGSTPLLLNDAYDAPVAVRILQQPAQGMADVDQSLLTYQPDPDVSGPDTVVYEICYVDCPETCDTALVLYMNVRNDDPCVIIGDTSNLFTNGLTPNGDGVNDLLVFRVVSVEDCQVNYAKSEIIIYNRWGDVVFTASPYSNDWGGTGPGGADLPPGVYYFVLRITLDRVYTQFGSVILLR